MAECAGAQEWYAWRKGYEKCMNTKEGLLVCREDYINDFCYGKERTWAGRVREKTWLDSGKEKLWIDKVLIAVRNLNSKCEYHGWSRFRQADGRWRWQCYIKGNAQEDAACKGFTKR